MLRLASRHGLRTLCLQRRLIATTTALWEAPEPTAVEGNEEGDEAESQSQSQGGFSQYQDFLLKGGAQYKYARPKNYLHNPDKPPSHSKPFPLNDSFRPPSPNSDALRTQIYQAYCDGKSVNQLSQGYHMSVKRIGAIIRLKAMENDWKKVSSTSNVIKREILNFLERFTLGMEHILSARRPSRVALPEARDPDLLDQLEEFESRDNQQQRLARGYWEPVLEDYDQGPVVLGSVREAKEIATRQTRLAQELKKDRRLMPIIKATPQIRRPPSDQTITSPGRHPIRFVDVGAKFMDVQERLRRINAANRRRGYDPDLRKVDLEQKRLDKVWKRVENKAS